MKIFDDPIARARLRMLQPYLTADQYRDICIGLKDVEAAAPGELRRLLVAQLCAGSKALVTRIRSMARLFGRRSAQGDRWGLH